MKRILLYVLAIPLILMGCGGEKGIDTSTLAGKKEQLLKLQKTLSETEKEISQLEAEITELDPNLAAAALKIPVSAKAVEVRDFKHFVKVQGQVEANRNILVSPEMPGNITQIYVKEGQRVAAGKVLAKLDDAVLQRNIEEVKTQLELAQILYDKQQRLWDQEIGTEVQLLQAKTQKESLERRLATVEEQVNMTRIKAPISGTIDEILPKIGEMVSPGMPVFRVVNTNDLSLKAQVSESYIPYIKRGDAVNVKFPALDKELNARVSVVGEFIHPTARTFDVEVKLPSSVKAKPNMFGEISINDRLIKNAILVPMYVLQKSESGRYVYVAEKNEAGEWIALRKDVVLGLSYQGEAVVEEGLDAKDLLITDGYKDLSDGQLIDIMNASDIVNN